MTDTKFFTKKVDLRSRKAMIDFLTNHFRYYTMNTWNRSTSYANNVKLYNLNLPSDISDKAYDFITGDLHNNPLDEIIPCLTDDFERKTGYYVGFNGRSSGYIVMYESIIENGKRKIFVGKSIDQDEDFKDWHITDIRERTKLVIAFDELCDNIRSALIDICQNYDIEKKEHTSIQMINCAVPNTNKK